MENLKQILSIRVSPSLYRRLKREIGEGKISEFVKKATIRELEERIKGIKIQKQKEFQQKLIADYKATARSQRIQKELEI